jgi:hypothetical protein
MSARDHLDHDVAVLDPLDRLVPGVDPQLVPDPLLDRDLSTLADPMPDDRSS